MGWAHPFRYLRRSDAAAVSDHVTDGSAGRQSLRTARIRGVTAHGRRQPNGRAGVAACFHPGRASAGGRAVGTRQRLFGRRAITDASAGQLTALNSYRGDRPATAPLSAERGSRSSAQSRGAHARALAHHGKDRLAVGARRSRRRADRRRLAGRRCRGQRRRSSPILRARQVQARSGWLSSDAACAACLRSRIPRARVREDPAIPEVLPDPGRRDLRAGGDRDAPDSQTTSDSSIALARRGHR